MYQTGVQQALKQYHSAGVLSEVADADPHRLIQMLFEGALERIAVARGAMLQGNMALKAERIGKALDILGGLSSHLDMEQGGEIATHLESLYEYMGRRLAEANLRNDPAILDEVSNLLREVKTGWDAIPRRQAAGDERG